ncbi:AAA-like domain protein [Halalkalicoccus paucihalophilus]|uniref:AAA-like domain protein n=1 Tax=Halalkalicoccus paucihalophilus TaxID=1008153 RepID=A0A151A840_9EURY|nr:TraM recognition domain-containing protein [Halalkalicoccus paucihalophilus]KYH23868.1 AAA-like domain protein [Halalkalicoccus paucihalophilus]
MGLFNRSTSDSTETNENDAEPNTPQSSEQDYDPTKPTIINSKEWAIERIAPVSGDLEIYAGEWPRAMVENAQYEPSQPVWVGCSERTGREFGVEFSRAFRHIAYLGSTGTGKTTAIYNSVTQLMMGGHGVAIVDPKGDDIYDLLRRVPKWRWDDVVYVDLGADYYSLEDEETGEDVPYQIGFNILDTYHEPGEPGFDEEIEWIVADLIELLAAGEYWGPRMDRIAKNMIRGMARHEEEFTIIEIYYALLEEENRQQYADLIGDSIDDDDIMFLEGFTRRIAEELSDDELDPLLGRLKDWVENPITRKIIAMRGAEVTLGQIVNEQKILIVNNDLPKEAKIMTANAVVSGIWTAVTSRKDPSEQQMMELAGMDDVGSEYAPFFLAIDECHSVLTDGDEIETMLMEARSKKLGLMLSTQVLRSLPDDAADAIISNCNTILSLTPNHPEEAREIANRFGGMDIEDLQRTPDYHAQTQLNSEDDPFLAKLIPPYPPRHTIEEAYELIVTSLENYGSPVQSGEEILDEMHFDAGGAISAGEAEAGASDGSDEQVDVTSDPAEQALYEAAYTVQIKRDAIGEFVASEAVKDEWRRRAGELGFSSEVSNVIEQAPDEYLQRQRRDGDSVMKVTPEGLEYAGLAQDTGSSASGGGDEHRWVLTEAYRAFTKLGMFVELPTQEGEEDPDGVADLPIDPMAAENIREVHAREERLAEEYPYLAKLTDGLNVSIEAETSTIKKPMQTLTNLRKAIDEHKLCVFACKDGSANHDEFGYWARRGEQIIYDVDGRGSNRTIDYEQLTFAADIDAQGNRTFYNKVSTLSVASDTYALRPQCDADLVWREDSTEVVMSDEDGTEYARFESPEAAATPAKSNVPAYSIYDASEQEYTVRAGGEKLVYGSREELEEDWMVVRAPFIPENEFDRMPTPKDFLFVVFPDEDTEAFDEPMIYERGEVRPLLPAETSWDSTEPRPEGAAQTPTGEAHSSAEERTEQTSGESNSEGITSSTDTEKSSSIADAVSRLSKRE